MALDRGEGQELGGLLLLPGSSGRGEGTVGRRGGGGVGAWSMGGQAGWEGEADGAGEVEGGGKDTSVVEGPEQPNSAPGAEGAGPC